MAQGDAKCAMHSLSAGSSVTVQPASGDHWTTHRYEVGGSADTAINFDVTDGSTQKTDMSGGGSSLGTFNNNFYFVLNNTSSCWSGWTYYIGFQHK